MSVIDKRKLYEDMYHEAFEVDSDMQKWDSGCWIRFKLFENVLARQENIDCVPVKRGRWINEQTRVKGLFAEYCYNCSECGRPTGYDRYPYTQYCPGCGAYMENVV